MKSIKNKINTRKLNVVRLGQLPLLKYYAPFSYIWLLSINKIINIPKFNVVRLGQVDWLKYYTPFGLILLLSINKEEKIT